MTHVAILGITGRVGSRIATELLGRQHTITGIARNIGQASAKSRGRVVIWREGKAFARPGYDARHILYPG